jgi:hypothetical protein
MTIHVKNAGTWKPITPWVRHAASAGWVQPKGVWVRNAGTWKKVWPDSDPQTWTWAADFTQTYRADGPAVTSDITSGLDATSDLMQGFWENMPPVGAGFVTSLIGFDHADIRAKLAVRPAVTKVRLRLAVKLDYGNQGTRARVATHNQGAQPSSFTYGSFHDENVYTDATKRAEGAVVWHTLPDSVGTQLRDNTIKGVGLYEYGRSTSEANKVEFRGAWYGEAASSSLEPVLEITADYN